jgi:hypothetical protein
MAPLKAMIAIGSNFLITVSVIKKQTLALNKTVWSSDGGGGSASVAGAPEGDHMALARTGDSGLGGGGLSFGLGGSGGGAGGTICIVAPGHAFHHKRERS